MPRLTRAAVIVGKSTVPVGTAAELGQRARGIAPPESTSKWPGTPNFCGRVLRCKTRCDRTALC
ncbi:putative uDP-glucose 6-dehydrogenase [Mycobacterium xenopi 3993]|nr:putative uDP-glucose 6-dehydrogenase [Mycobacterium xenopi 3993]